MSRYELEIIRKHKLAPELGLKELQRAKFSDVDPSLKPWDKLSGVEKSNRNLSLELLRRLRDGKSLTNATKDVGVSTDFTRKYLGNNIVRVRNRWLPRESDRLQRSMHFYEKNIGITNIIVTNSQDASKIGKYFASVKQALKTGNKSLLDEFEGEKISDAEDIEHEFETDLEKLFEIEERKEEPEFFEIYNYE